MDSYPTRANSIDEMLDVMLRKLDQHPRFKFAWKIYAGERNTGHVSGQHAINVVSRYPRTYSLRERADRHHGIWLNKDRKQIYADHMRKILRQDALLFYDQFVFYHQGKGTPEQRRRELRAMLEGQLRACVPDGKGGWTGKTDVNGKRIQGQVDDLSVAMCMALYVALNFLGKRFPFVDWSRFSNTSIRAVPDESGWRGPSRRAITHAQYVY